MKTNYTPGPWIFQTSLINGFEFDIATSDFETFIAATYETEETTEANARLIAAAPELLEVIKTVLAETQAAEGFNMEKAFQLLDWLKDHGNDLMRNAIAKATGEPVI
jgi:hypothetical protein